MCHFDLLTGGFTMDTLVRSVISLGFITSTCFCNHVIFLELSWRRLISIQVSLNSTLFFRRKLIWLANYRLTHNIHPTNNSIIILTLR